MTAINPQVMTRNAYAFHRLRQPNDALTFAAGSITYAALAAAAYTYAKRHGWKATLRRNADGSVTVIRDSSTAARQQSQREQAALVRALSTVANYLMDRAQESFSEADLRSVLGLTDAALYYALGVLREHGKLRPLPDGRIQWRALPRG